VFACLQVIFIFSLLGNEEMLQGEYKYPAWTIMVGWILTASSLLCIPLYIVYKLIVTPGNIVQVNFKCLKHNCLKQLTEWQVAVKKVPTDFGE
jgi:hypothetical protein